VIALTVGMKGGRVLPEEMLRLAVTFTNISKMPYQDVSPAAARAAREGGRAALTPLKGTLLVFMGWSVAVAGLNAVSASSPAQACSKPVSPGNFCYN